MRLAKASACIGAPFIVGALLFVLGFKCNMAERANLAEASSILPLFFFFFFFLLVPSLSPSLPPFSVSLIREEFFEPQRFKISAVDIPSVV